jgi:exodeoxyribonuclease III
MCRLAATSPIRLPIRKFAHRLAFLDEMVDWMATERIGGSGAIIAGDLNIAPLETDVWNHKALLRVVSHTPVEVEKLNLVRAAGPWVDALRHFVPPEEKLYTWWSYRARDWQKSDRGRRLDHVWVSHSLKPRLDGARVLRESRGWERASDHVPVLVHFDF